MTLLTGSDMSVINLGPQIVRFSYVLALEKKNGNGEKMLLETFSFCLKVIRSLNRNKETVTFACEVKAAKSIKHISKSSPQSSNISDYTRRAHVLRDALSNAFRKRTFKN